MAASCSSQNNNVLEVVETDPTGRYVRYDTLLGEGVTKEVYLGFDSDDAKEIAWSKLTLTTEVLKCKYLDSLRHEASLLNTMDHENIVRCYYTWTDGEGIKTVHMITELFTSGNLVEYISIHNLANNLMVIKDWCRQILKGLGYLHRRGIIHLDMKCENIFVNGNTGVVKLGDFGHSVREEASREQKHGTPVFMAPELLGENYSHLVDIYSFGLCVLQMVTREHPYLECRNTEELEGMLLLGVKPAVLSRVTDPEVKRFIERCLAPASVRPDAVDLLKDPFLGASSSVENLSPRKIFFRILGLCQRKEERLQRGKSENKVQRQQEPEQRGESESEVQRQQEEGQQREGEGQGEDAT